MTYEELTPRPTARYDGYMDQSSEQTPQEVTPEEEVRPGPVTPEGQSLLRNAQNGAETGEAPAATVKNPDQEATAAAQKSRPTREALVEISRDIFKTTSPSEVRSKYDQVAGLGRILLKYLPPTEQKAFADTVWPQIELIGKSMGNPSDNVRPDKPDIASREQVLGQRAAIADAAKKLKTYFEREKLITSEDPYRQITSFEEFMAKVADITEKDDYKPGGKFQLLEVHVEQDKFGREIKREIAHPENFHRWMRERIWFYHDFSPTSQIKLFEEIYIPTAYRTISLGEILYGGTNVYFAHRVPQMTKLQLSQGFVYEKTHGENPKFRFTDANGKDIDPDAGEGYYLNVETGERFKLILSADAYGRPAYSVFEEKTDEEGNKVMEDVMAEDENKEHWQSVPDTQLENVKGDILYEAWILTFFHNYDVEYRLKGMASEKPLNDVMADICGINMMTQDRDRLLRLLRMQSTEKKDEARKRLEGGPSEQGSVGKAMQRALAGYYHLAEANASAKGFGLDNEFNAFTEVMKGREIDGAQEFYKSLVDQTLETEFGDRVEGMKELVDMLNNLKINARYDLQAKEFGQDDFAAETLRERNDYEKVQLFEAAFLDDNALKALLRDRYRIRPEDFDATLKKLRDNLNNKEGYEGADGKKRAYDPEKSKRMLEQLDAMGNRGKVLKLLDGRHGFSSGSGYAKAFAEKGLDELDAFAVKFLVQPFDTSITSSADIWENISYDQRAAKRVRAAMRHAIARTEKLNDFEAKYAEEWAFVMTYFTGISARNDINGIGHDAYSKIQNTEFYRLRQTSGGNYPGNLDNLYGIHRLGVNMWEGLKVQREEKDTSNKLDTTLYEVLTGLRKGEKGGYYFDINADVGTFDFHGNAMRQFHSDHLNHAIELFIDITSKQEFNIDKLVEKDQHGHLTWKHEEMQKMIDSTWKHLRYGFDNRGFLYDNVLYGWWYDETVEFDEKAGKRGQVKRTPHYGLKTLRDSMFSQEVQDMRMYERLDLSGWAGLKNGKHTDIYETKMGRNVFAYLISAQLREHTRYRGGYRHYSADEVEMITNAFMNYAARVMKGQEGETIVLSGFFNAEEITRILVAAHAVLWMLYLREMRRGAESSFLFGFFEAFVLIMKQAGAGIKL